MEFFKRWKKDAKFRKNVIIVIIIALFVLNSGEPQQQAVSKAICDQSNTGNFIVTEGAASSCKANGCAVQMNWNPDTWGWLGDIANFIDFLLSKIGLNSDFATCTPTVQTGKWLVTSSTSKANNLCESGKGVKVKDRWFTEEDVYQCVEADPETQCKSWEKPIAGMLDAIWKNNDLGCSAKAYIVMGAALFIFLAVI